MIWSHLKATSKGGQRDKGWGDTPKGPFRPTESREVAVPPTNAIMDNYLKVGAAHTPPLSMKMPGKWWCAGLVRVRTRYRGRGRG